MQPVDAADSAIKRGLWWICLVAAPAVPVTNGNLSAVFPANSITMLVIPPASLPGPKPGVTAGSAAVRIISAFQTLNGCVMSDQMRVPKAAIRAAWLTVVLPALTLNYLGQGALVLVDPKSIENPFFLLYPDWALLPMVVLATAATVIASQAVISGACGSICCC